MAKPGATVFRIIGQYDISRDGEDVIRVWSAHEFNLEAAHQYALDMMRMIEQMPPRFATMVSFDSPPVVGPEVEAAMRRSARDRAARGMVAVAFVTLNPEALDVARGQWERIYEGSGIALRFFREEPPALAWLHQRIATIGGASD